MACYVVRAVLVLSSSWPIVACVFVFGALVGSFLNVVIARLPAGESIAWPGSRCPKCKTPIRPYHNVPLLSWLVLRGRCAACKAPISARYPMVELITAVVFTACAFRFGLSWGLPGAWTFAGALIAVTFIDLDIWEIPDEITLFGLPIALALRPLVFQAPWWSGLVGAALGASILLGIRWVYFALRGVEAMGLGDVKLLAFIGAFLGPVALIPVLVVASMFGSFAGLILIAVDRWGPHREERAESLSTEAAENEEAWAAAPKAMRLGLIVRSARGKWSLGPPHHMQGRTHVRVGLLFGWRGSKARSGGEVMLGVFQDIPGWGHFEGLALGHPLRIWGGPLVGARLADVEAFGDEEEWEPPPTAVPFGPFLAFGALAVLLLSPAFGRWSALLGL